MTLLNYKSQTLFDLDETELLIKLNYEFPFTTSMSNKHPQPVERENKSYGSETAV